MPEQDKKGGFIGFGATLSQTIELYKKGIGRFLLLALLTVVTAPLMIAGFVGSFLLAALLRMPAAAWLIYVPVILIAVIVFVYIVTWLSAATVMLVAEVDGGEAISFRKLLISSRRYVVSLWKTQLLSGLIVLTGMMLFVVPGIVFSLWFSFAILIVVLEGKGGFEALARSREYMRGYTRNYFVYMIMAVLLLSIVTQVPIYVLNSIDLKSVASVYSVILQFLTMPLGTIYIYVIYKYLKNMKGDISSEVAKAPLGKYKAAAFAALIIPFALVVIAVLAISQLPSGFFESMFNQPKDQQYEYQVPEENPMDTII